MTIKEKFHENSKKNIENISKKYIKKKTMNAKKKITTTSKTTTEDIFASAEEEEEVTTKPLLDKDEKSKPLGDMVFEELLKLHEETETAAFREAPEKKEEESMFR